MKLNLSLVDITLLMSQLLGLAVNANEIATEYQMHFHYSVHCNEQKENSFPGLTGEIHYLGRSTRFNLFKYLNEISINLQTRHPITLNEVEIKVPPSASCKLETLEPHIEQVSLDPKKYSDLARIHSPYLMIRPDQLLRPERDVHLGLAYSVLQKPRGFSIRYTYFFSNETVSGPFTTSKKTSLGSYGRRSDVEWIYQVEFAVDGKIVSRVYQGGILFGIGHKTHRFNGNFIYGTEHPILYDIANHNVFGTKPPFGTFVFRKVGESLLPDEEIVSPNARETWLWARPWTFDVTDRELARQRKLSFHSDQYLYIRIHGKLNKGKIQPALKRLKDSLTVLAGEGKATIKVLGEDLFGKETFSAIKISAEDLIAGGNIHIKRSSAKTELESPKFYQLVKDAEKGYRAHDISARFNCGTPYDCKF